MNEGKVGKVRDINEIDFENEKPPSGYKADFTINFVAVLMMLSAFGLGFHIMLFPDREPPNHWLVMLIIVVFGSVLSLWLSKVVWKSRSRVVMALKKEFFDRNGIDEPKKSYGTTEKVHKRNTFEDKAIIVIFCLLVGMCLSIASGYIFEDIVGYEHDATPFVALSGLISGTAITAWIVWKANKGENKPENADAVMDGIRTIMLIDNDPYQNNAMRCEFSWLGYSMLTATSFGEARAMLEDNEPDLILMEADLPDGDGFDFYKEIRGRTAASIIFLTVKSDDADMIRGLKMGVDEYIKKPFDRKVMVARVENVMKWRRRLGDKIHSAHDPVESETNT